MWVLCKVGNKKNKLPLFACDGRKNSPAELVIKKTKSFSPKKLREKTDNKASNQDQAAAPYHCSTPSFVKKFGIILYILILLL